MTFDRTADAARYEVVGAGSDAALFAAAALEPADRVLDIGCGYGRTTLRAAAQAPDGEAVGIDIAAPLLAEARATAARTGVRNVSFVHADAQTHRFPEAAFDVALSRNGVMFFADHTAAFSHIGHALRPGGRLAFTVPGDPASNELPQVLGAALRGLLPSGMTRSGAPGVSSLADPGRIRDVLTGAGYERITVTGLGTTLRLGATVHEAAAFLRDWGAVRDALPDPESPAVTEALAAALAPFGPSLRATAWLVSARRPVRSARDGRGS
ncbi:class I SAM-dependent methyltransferase [Streptomyces avicenniae]|uniref:class I SAM-dependent methyltransferase n=1 Tax=Streptomyces avicenniae TaxID=500153 RepID=UPI00069B059A|nr:class I SAM-dependent methyltransferase [Streptomyces avicenniae]